MADGCVQINNGYKFTMTCKDSEHLIKLKEDIEYTGKAWRYRSGNGNHPTMNIRDKYFVLNMVGHGVIPRKTNKLIFPKTVPENLLNHFIRGYVDGDGYVSYREKNEEDMYPLFIMGVAGRERFIEKIADILKSNCDLKSCNVNKHSQCNLWIITKTAMEATKVCKYLYKDANVYLDRKYNNFMKYIDRKSIEL